jgi:predicted NAD/FAD-binding protein
VDLFETWNPITPLDQSKVLKRIQFERPLVTTESLDAVQRLKPYNGLGGIWFCGAWNAHRIPLQESGVVSALNVCTALLGHQPMGEWQVCNSRPEILAEIRRVTSGECILGWVFAIHVCVSVYVCIYVCAYVCLC